MSERAAPNNTIIYALDVTCMSIYSNLFIKIPLFTVSRALTKSTKTNKTSLFLHNLLCIRLVKLKKTSL